MNVPSYKENYKVATLAYKWDIFVVEHGLVLSYCLSSNIKLQMTFRRKSKFYNSELILELLTYVYAIFSLALYGWNWFLVISCSF